MWSVLHDIPFKFCNMVSMCLFNCGHDIVCDVSLGCDLYVSITVRMLVCDSITLSVLDSDSFRLTNGSYLHTE